MEVSTINLLNNDFILTFGKGIILLILSIYAIFSLIIVRQVDLMGKTLITNLAPIVRLFAFVHAGFAIGLIVLTWWIL